MYPFYNIYIVCLERQVVLISYIIHYILYAISVALYMSHHVVHSLPIVLRNSRYLKQTLIIFKLVRLVCIILRQARMKIFFVHALKFAPSH